MLQAIGQDWVSIHDVAASRGLELDNDQAWEVGKIVEKKWTKLVGAQPHKDLRRKKQGPGSHCFALYPPSWIPVIEEAIFYVGAMAAAQCDLFYPNTAVASECAEMEELFGGMV